VHTSEKNSKSGFRFRDKSGYFLSPLSSIAVGVRPDRHLGNLIALLVQYLNVALNGCRRNIHLDLLGNNCARLKPLVRNAQPYSKRIAHRGIWVEPELLAEIEYRAKSAEGKVRHPFFKGIREDL
jgi:ATP dependent DNA ligase C terminal region